MRDSLRSCIQKRLPEDTLDQLRALRSFVRYLRRALQRTHRLNELKVALTAAGVGVGDVLMVHSSLSRLGKVERGAATVIEALLGTVTAQGTVLMPAYADAKATIEASHAGHIVDLRTAPSNSGIITEAFRSWPHVLRSSHPFSSVSGWGKHAAYLTSGHAFDPRICHRDSPLGRLLTLGGKIVGLGVSLGPVSFYHVVEDTWAGFPFDTYLTAVSISYIDAHGVAVTRPVQRYNPEISRTRIDTLEGAWIRAFMTRHLTAAGLLQRFTFGQASAWVIEAQPLYEELKRLAERGITIYTTEAQLRIIQPALEGSQTPRGP